MKPLRPASVYVVVVYIACTTHAVEMKTSDGLALRLSDRTGYVEAVEIAGQTLPLLQPRFPVSVRELKPMESRKNLVPNPGLEEGVATVDSWPHLGEGAARVTEFNHTTGGKYCGKLAAPPGASESSPANTGQFRSIVIPAKPNTLYGFRAWGLVPKGSSGGNVFIVEMDAAGNIIWEGKYHVQHCLGWRESTDGQWVQREMSFVTKPNCAQFHIYANIWKGYGVFYFDDVELFDLTDLWNELTLAPQRIISSSDGKTWTQRIFAPDANLALELRYSVHNAHIWIDMAVQDMHQPVKHRALQIRYILPIDLQGWTWHDDGRRFRLINRTEKMYENSIPVASSCISRYPFTSVTKGKTGLSLAVPMDPLRIQNLLYTVGQGYMSTMDVGLSPLTKKLGEGKASLSLLIYTHDGEWGFRAAAQKYYEIFPNYFLKRAQREGVWFYVVPPRSIPYIEDFGLTFYEGGPFNESDTAFAREKGIYILPYTEPWGARQVFPKAINKEDLPPYEERLAQLKKWAEDRDSPDKLLRGPRWEIAQAILNSLPYDKYGRAPFSVDKYGAWAHWWRTMTNPHLPKPNRGETCWRYEIEPVLPSSDGIYLDSVTLWLANFLNFREEHYPSAETPLLFDPLSGRPAMLGMASHYEFMKWLADKLHAQGKLVHMNIFAETYRFCAHLADVLGSEVGSSGRKRNLADVESDECSLLRRMLAYQKPTSNLLQEGNYTTPVPELSQAEVEQYIKHQMFYGFYPGIATIGGEDKPGYIGWKRYFGMPAQYERDRALFKKYIPLIKQLCAAGWEPVTLAKTSNEYVFIERYGSLEKNNLHFTLRNIGEKAEHFSITLQLPDADKLIVRDLLTGAVLSANVEMTLPPKESSVIRVER